LSPRGPLAPLLAHLRRLGVTPLCSGEVQPHRICAEPCQRDGVGAIGLQGELAATSWARCFGQVLMRPVSWAQMAISTRLRAFSLRIRVARWVLTVLMLM
jgi:hypothetical protein